MAAKITIIGAGSVGATIAYTLSQEDIASELVLIDINKSKVEGEVMDIIQGTCFRDPISVVAGDYKDAKDSDIVIITSGISRRPGQTRLELMQTNVDKKHKDGGDHTDGVKTRTDAQTDRGGCPDARGGG